MFRGLLIYRSVETSSSINVSNRINSHRRNEHLNGSTLNTQSNKHWIKNYGIFFPVTFRQQYATQIKLSEHWTKNEKTLRIPKPISRLDEICQTMDPNNREVVHKLLQEILGFDGFLNQVLFGKVIKYFSNIGALDDMEKAFKQILQMRNKNKTKTEPNLVVVNEVMSAFAKHGDKDKVHSYLDQMPQWNLSPDVVTYTILINYHLKDRNLPKALEYFSAMKKAGVKPNSVTYNALMRTYLQQKQPEKAVDILREMEDNQVPADRFTFNLFVNGFGRLGDVKNMFLFFELAQKLGHKPDIVTFTSMLSGIYNTSNTTVELDKLLEKMKEFEVKPDAQFCNLLISAFGKFNQKDRLVQLLKNMEDEGMRMDQTSLESAMAKLTRVGVLEQAESFFHKICASYTPSLVCCNVYLDVLGKLGKLDQMLVFFEDIAQKYGHKPDTVSYTTVLASIIRKDQLQGLQFFENNKSVMNPNEYSYNIILDTLSECNPQLMFKYYDEMKSSGIKPSLASYVPIFKALRQHMDIQNIYKYLHLLRMEGLKPNLLIYTIILDAVAKRGDSARTKQLLDDMEKEGIKADATTYTTLISSMYTSPKMHQLNEFLQRVRADGVRPTTELYNSILSAATHSESIRNEPQHIIRIKDVMISQGVKPNMITFNILLAYFGQIKHDLKNALMYYRQIYQAGFSPDSVTIESLTTSIKVTLRRPPPCKPWTPYDSPYEEQMDKLVATLLEQYASSNAEDREAQLRQEVLNEMVSHSRNQHHKVVLMFNGIVEAIQKNIVPAQIIDSAMLCIVVNAHLQMCQNPLNALKIAQKLGVSLDEQVLIRLMEGMTRFDNFKLVMHIFHFIQLEYQGKVPLKVLAALFDYYKDQGDLNSLSALLTDLEKDPSFEYPAQAFGALAACGLRMVQHYKNTGSMQNSFNTEQVVGMQNLVKSTIMKVIGENLAFDIDAANEFIYFFIVTNDLACVELVLRELTKRQLHLNVVTLNMLLQLGNSRRTDIRMYEFENAPNLEWNQKVFDLSINTSNNKEANDIITDMQTMLGRQ